MRDVLSSWKTKKITRTKEEALEILRSFKTEIESSKNFGDYFEKIAKRESDCSSHKKGGDLGWFGKGQMQKPFEVASFALEIGELSDIVETSSGVHLIYRTG